MPVGIGFLTGVDEDAASSSELEESLSFCKVVFKKGGSTQNKNMEMTYEEMQRELGLGVDVH